MPRDLARSRPVLAIMVIAGVSLVLAGGWLFNAVWQQNTFPRGEKSGGREYAVEGSVYKGFSSDPGRYYNATDNTTALPLISGELVYSYKLAGDQRGRFQGGDLVVVTTVWNGSLEEQSQPWRAERYYPPHQQFAILSYLVFLGIWSILAALAIRVETGGNMAAAMLAASLLPTMLYVPAYFLDAGHWVACCTVFSVVLFVAFLALIFMGFRQPVKSERRKKGFRLAMAVVISSFVAMIVGVAVGVLCAGRYAGGFF